MSAPARKRPPPKKKRSKVRASRARSSSAREKSTAVAKRVKPVPVHRSVSKKKSAGNANTNANAIERDLEVHREELATQNEELRRANAALLTATERYAQLYDGAPMAYFTLDEDGLIVEANFAGAKLLEATRNFVFGRNFDEMVVPSSRESFRNFRRRVLEHGGRPVHETMLMMGAHRFHVHIAAARLAGPVLGGVLGPAHCVLCVSDETERRHLEDERRVLEKRIADADRLESLGLLAGGVAHDFNDLLATALANAELVLLATQQESQLDAVTKIRDSLMRATVLAKQMLAYTGLGRLEPEPLDVSGVVRSMSDLLASTTTPKDVLLKLELADGLPLIAGESVQLQQIITNLVQNAVEAIAPGAGKIVLRTRCEGSLDGSRSGAGTGSGSGSGSESEPSLGRIIIEVSDDGRGMDDATRQRAFDPFFSTKLAGKGLGLAVVHGNVRAHGGSVEVESRLHQGTTFRVYLPSTRSTQQQHQHQHQQRQQAQRLSRHVVVAQRQQRAQAQSLTVHANDVVAAPGPPASSERGSERSSERGWRGSGLVLLVVHDEADVREGVGKVLEYVGFDVCHARDGVDALGIVRQRSSALVAVLLDLTTTTTTSSSPTNHETLGQLKQLAPALPVVLTSGLSEAHLDETLMAQASGFLPKPFTLATLVRVMQHALGQHPTQEAAGAMRPTQT